MKSLIFFSLFIFLSNVAMAQDQRLFEIKEVVIKDTTLIKIIDDFSESKMSSDSLYRAGLGYLIISAVNPSKNVLVGSKQSFYLNIDYFDFDGGSQLPIYYAFNAKGRPILIYTSNISEVTTVNIYQDSKSFKKVVEPYLPPIIGMPDLMDPNKKVKARANYRIQMHGGLYFFKMANNSYKAIQPVHIFKK
jgi:hypothetical protein